MGISISAQVLQLDVRITNPAALRRPRCSAEHSQSKLLKFLKSHLFQIQPLSC